jgi:neuronal cell adhesion molecule
MITIFYCADVPNPPRLKGITCRDLEASVSWEPRGDNRAPVLRYTIQYNTSFTPDSWDIAADSVPATESTYSVIWKIQQSCGPKIKNTFTS